MILKLDIEVKRLSIEQANECDKDTLCFDFGRIIGDSLWQNIGGVLIPKNDLVYSFVNALEKPTYLVNVIANNFVADTTYLDFPFKCEIEVTGVTSANNAEVTFSLTQATSGDLAPICVTDTNKVIIYAKSDLGSIVIPLIKVEVVL